MCGRFVQYSTIESLQKIFAINTVRCDHSPNYNIAPTQKIMAIVNQDNKKQLENLHGGLVPFWAKDISIGSGMINARVETVAKKLAFRNAFIQRRYLIPADGFYEWKGEEGQRQPYFINAVEGTVFSSIYHFVLY